MRARVLCVRVLHLCIHPSIYSPCQPFIHPCSYERASKDGTNSLEGHEHEQIVLRTKTDEMRRVVAADPAERVRYKLQQDKNEYLEAATSAMQHFIERERKRYQKQVRKLSTKFSPPEVLASLQKNTTAHRFWTRSVRDSLEAVAKSARHRRQVLQKLQAINASVRYDDPAQRLARYVCAYVRTCVRTCLPACVRA